VVAFLLALLAPAGTQGQTMRQEDLHYSSHQVVELSSDELIKD
jgi:hypothetical protein